MSAPPVYLDYAATSAIRPHAVAEAVVGYLRDTGATAGRGGHRLALEAGRTALRCRRALAQLLDIPGDPGRIAFQANATHALNTALFGVLEPGDRVVRTVYDHNSVRRPLAALRARGVRVDMITGTPDGRIDLDEAERILAGAGPAAGAGAAKLLVLTHASNVLDNVLPVAELAAMAHAVGALVLLDTAQTAGHLPFSVASLGVDLLAFTGHKGLLAPQGTGGLWVRDGVAVEPLIYGGTGSESWSESMPDAYPDHLEAGTQNGPGLAGLLAGTEWLLDRGVAGVHATSTRLKQRFLHHLSSMEGITLHSSPRPGGVGIVTVTAARIPAAELARRLDHEYGIMTRAGLHCAPDAHELIGTVEQGAVRFSLGWASTESDVDRACRALAELTGNAAASSAVPIPAPSSADEPGDEGRASWERGSNGTR
jgi:cysteine desulfurase / selenocysteine lyase